MKKRFLLDTNVLMRTPNAIYVFDDNDVLICDTTLEELDDNKTKPGDAGYNAREATRTLNKLREDNGNLYSGVPLPGGGTLTIVRDCYPEDVKEMDECFVTNSLMGIMPVRKLGGIKFTKKEKSDILREKMMADEEYRRSSLSYRLC